MSNGKKIWWRPKLSIILVSPMMSMAFCQRRDHRTWKFRVSKGVVRLIVLNMIATDAEFLLWTRGQVERKAEFSNWREPC